jgi:site-specific recombinase XerD
MAPLLSYLNQHRSTGTSGAGRGAEVDHLFLTELSQPLTKNALTLVFARLNKRARITGTSISPSMLRDTFAVRALQAGGEPEAVLAQLGLHDQATFTRYERLCQKVREDQQRNAHRADRRGRDGQDCTSVDEAEGPFGTPILRTGRRGLEWKHPQEKEMIP